MEKFKNTILIKKNGITNEFEKTKELKMNLSNDGRKHVCWQSCPYEKTRTCPKVKDEKKANIYDYDFITDGYQIFDKEGNLSIFVVTDCERALRDEIKPIKKKKNSLLLARELLLSYYGINNVEELDNFNDLGEIKEYNEPRKNK